MASIFFMMVSSTVIGPRRGAEGDDPEPIAPTDSRQESSTAHRVPKPTPAKTAVFSLVRCPRLSRTREFGSARVAVARQSKSPLTPSRGRRLIEAFCGLSPCLIVSKSLVTTS
jgi:hypothetical protein